ncbi:MAG: BrnT family toxin [Sedimentisphaerales bacterium]|jgi:uncharacterized DUF497 family protein|nr:BrnT family toxin [Sedimentisphaerales bacterium]
MIEFEWDPEKAKANLLNHRLGFAEAATVFRDPLAVTVFDPDHSDSEDRFLTIGLSDRDRAVIVAHTDRGERIRIVSARELTRGERKDYEKEIERRSK